MFTTGTVMKGSLTCLHSRSLHIFFETGHYEMSNKEMSNKAQFNFCLFLSVVFNFADRILRGSRMLLLSVETVGRIRWTYNS